MIEDTSFSIHYLLNAMSAMYFGYVFSVVVFFFSKVAIQDRYSRWQTVQRHCWQRLARSSATIFGYELTIRYDEHK